MAIKNICIINWSPWKPISSSILSVPDYTLRYQISKSYPGHDQIYFEQRFYDQVETIWIEELKKVYDSLPSHVDVEYDYSEMGLFEG